MKLAYWHAPDLSGDREGDIRTRTKREAVAIAEQNPGTYGPVIRVEVTYADGFDLLLKCSETDRNHWEPR